MYVDDRGYGRLLVQVVVQIEAEADAYEDPEDAEPDQRSPAIVTRGPGCGCMDVQSFPLPVRKPYSNGTDAMKLFFANGVMGWQRWEDQISQPPTNVILTLSIAKGKDLWFQGCFKTRQS